MGYKGNITPKESVSFDTPSVTAIKSFIFLHEKRGWVVVKRWGKKDPDTDIRHFVRMERPVL